MAQTTRVLRRVWLLKYYQFYPRFGSYPVRQEYIEISSWWFRCNSEETPHTTIIINLKLTAWRSAARLFEKCSKNLMQRLKITKTVSQKDISEPEQYRLRVFIHSVSLFKGRHRPFVSPYNWVAKRPHWAYWTILSSCVTEALNSSISKRLFVTTLIVGWQQITGKTRDDENSLQKAKRMSEH